MKRIVFAVMIVVAISGAAVAEAGTSGMTASTSLNFIAATTLETKVKLIETLTVPCLAGDSALTSGNNAQFKFGAELSPVSVNGTVEARLTPIAFLQFVAGGSVGSGWNIPLANGMRKNDPVLDSAGNHTGSRELVGGPFDGMVCSVKGGGLFQFDLAAVVPGDWNHVVFQSYHAAQYRALTSASPDESWLYEADEGENRNGWSYYGNYFLGYQMPLRLNMVGMLFEEDLYLYNKSGSSDWGDDMSRWTFGPMLNFKVSKNVEAALLSQWRTRRNFTAETENYDFYQDRRVTGTRHVDFYRAALNVTVKLN